MPAVPTRAVLTFGSFGVLLTLVAALAYASAAQWSNGVYSLPAFRLLCGALLATAAAAAFAGRGAHEGVATTLGLAAFFGLLVETAWLLMFPPTASVRPDPPFYWFDVSLLMLCGAVALVAVGLFRDRPALVLPRRSLFLASFLLGAGWLLAASPNPFIDVWHYNQGASDRLLHLQNPYTMEIPNVYAQAVLALPSAHVPQTATVYSYPYPPINVLAQAPFYALTGDTRWASVVALVVLAAAVVALARRAGLPEAAADAVGAFVLFQPRVYFLVDQAWIEPLAAALLASAVLAHSHGRTRTAIILFGLAAYSKQYLAILLPLLLWVPGFGWRRAAASAGVAAVVALPFFLANPAAFWYGNVALLASVPPRLDSLAFVGWFASVGLAWPTWTAWIAWVGGGLGIAHWRRHHSAGVWLALAVALSTFFAFGKLAFGNYYWLVAVVLVLAAVLLVNAAPPTSLPPPAPAEPPAPEPREAQPLLHV